MSRINSDDNLQDDLLAATDRSRWLKPDCVVAVEARFRLYSVSMPLSLALLSDFN